MEPTTVSPIAGKLAASLVLLALGATSALSVTSTSPPYLWVDHLMPWHVGHEIRILGYVEPGSIERTGDAYHFVVMRDGARLSVIARELPDMIRDQAELVAEGRLERDHLEATTILTRCPTKYDGSDAVRRTSFR